MSVIDNGCSKECTVKLVKLTKEEIEKYTGKTYQEAEKNADSTTDRKPIIFVRRDIQNDTIMDIKTTQDTDNKSDIEKDAINNMEDNETQDTDNKSDIEEYIINNMEDNETQDSDNKSDIEEDINNMEDNETQDTDDKSDIEEDIINNMEDNETQDTDNKSDIEEDIINNMEDNETQDTDDKSDIEEDIINNMEDNETEENNGCVSDMENYGVNNMEIDETEEGSEYVSYMENYGVNNMEIDSPQVAYNMYAGTSDVMPNTIFQPYVQNNMDINTTEGNDYIYNPTSYNPNIVIKQETQDNYGVYPYVNAARPQMAGYSQVNVKQEVVDESYNESYGESYITHGYHNMYSEYIPNTLINQPTQNFGMPSYMNPGTSNMTNGSNPLVAIKQEPMEDGNNETYMNPGTSNMINGSNPHYTVTVKREIMDDGNIETYTNVLRPSADQEYEDGSP